MAHRNNIGPENKFPLLQNYLSQKKFRANSPKAFPKKKILTKPKFQIPRKSPYLQKEQNTFLEQEEEPENRLNRVRSLNGENMFNVGHSDENLIQFYQKQNQNLTKQNKFLLKEIRKRKENENNLLAYIEHLKQQIAFNKKLQTPRDKLRTAEKTCVETVGSSENFFPSFCQDQYRSEAEIQHMNIRFNRLMEECSKEKIKKEKMLKREQVAELAEKMKAIRKNLSYFQ